MFNEHPAKPIRARELHRLLGLPTDEATVNITRSRLGRRARLVRLSRRDVLTQPRTRRPVPETDVTASQRAGIGTVGGRHSRLINPNTHVSDTSPFTMHSSRSVPSRTNPIFSRTRADATLRVSVSA